MSSNKENALIINIHDIVDINDGVDEISPEKRDEIVEYCANAVSGCNATKAVIIFDSSQDNPNQVSRKKPKNLNVLLSQLEDIGFNILSSQDTSIEKYIRSLISKFIDVDNEVFVVNSNNLPFVGLSESEVKYTNNDFLKGSGFKSLDKIYEELGSTGLRNIVALSGLPLRGLDSGGKKVFIQQSVAEQIVKKYSLTSLYEALNNGDTITYDSTDGSEKKLSNRQVKALLSDDAKSVFKNIIKDITTRYTADIDLNDLKKLDFDNFNEKFNELKNQKSALPVRDLPISINADSVITIIDSAASLPSVNLGDSHIFSIELLSDSGKNKGLYLRSEEGNKYFFKIDNYLSEKDIFGFLKASIPSDSDIITSDSKALSRSMLDCEVKPFINFYDVSVGLFALSEFSVDKMTGDHNSTLNNLPEVSGIKPFGLDSFSKNYFMTKDSDSIGDKYLAGYGEMISKYSIRAKKFIDSKLFVNKEVYDFYKNIEFKLPSILAKMEKDGAYFDNDVCDQNILELTRLRDDLLSSLSAYSDKYGVDISPSNNESVVSYLQETLPDLNSRVKKVGANKAVLAEIESLYPSRPDISMIKKCRELETKIRSFKTLQKWIDPNTGMVYPRFNHLTQVTGRLSVTDPNLQGLPKSIVSNSPRDALLARPNKDKDMSIVCIDYSQMDFISLANASKDPKFISDIRNGVDMHRLNASLIYDKPQEEVTSSERSSAKAVGLGVVYGMGEQKIAEETGLSSSDIKAYKHRLFSYYPSLREAQNRFKEAAIKDNAVYTLKGRKLSFPNTKHWDRFLRRTVNAPEKPYKAIALIGQGTSAEIIKTAMVKVNELIPEEDAKMLLQVHDELIFEVPTEKVKEVSFEIKKIMENCISLDVSPKAEVSFGKSWGAKVEIKEDNFDISSFINIDDDIAP